MVINLLYCTVNLSYPHNPSHEMYVWSPKVSGIKIFFMTWWTPKLSSTVVGKDNDNYKIGIQGPCPTPYILFLVAGARQSCQKLVFSVSWILRNILKNHQDWGTFLTYSRVFLSHFKDIDTLYLDKLLLLK